MRESKVKNLRARTMAFLIAVILPACNGTYTSWERDKQMHGIAFQ